MSKAYVIVMGLAAGVVWGLGMAAIVLMLAAD